MIKPITVLIPCNYRRQYQVKQAITTLWKSGYKGKILLADRGEPRLNIDYFKDLKSYADISHLPLSPSDSFYTRLIDSLTNIDTPYVCLHPDDDIMFGDVINQSVEFLKSNKDFSFCGGKSVRLSSMGDTPGQKAGIYQFLSFELPDLRKRIFSLCASFNQHFWGTMRTHDMLEKAKYLREKFDTDVMFNQYFDSIFTAYLGKTKVIPKIGLVRFIDKNNGGIQLGANINKDHFPWLLNAADFSSKYEHFRKSVAELIDVPDEWQDRSFQVAMVNIIKWGIAMERSVETDKIFIPQLLKVPSEAGKVRYSKQVLLDRMTNDPQDLIIQELWG